MLKPDLHDNARVAVVFSGGRKLHEICAYETSSLASIAQRKCVENLAEDAVRECIAFECGMPVAKAWCAFVHEQTGGQPWLVATIASELKRQALVKDNVDARGKLGASISRLVQAQTQNWVNEFSEDALEIVAFLRGNKRITQAEAATRLGIKDLNHKRVSQAMIECVCAGIVDFGRDQRSLIKVNPLFWQGVVQKQRLHVPKKQGKVRRHQFQWDEASIVIPGHTPVVSVPPRFVQVFRFLFDRPNGKNSAPRNAASFEQVCVLWYAGCVLEEDARLVASANQAFEHLDVQIGKHGEDAQKKVAQYFRSQLGEWCKKSGFNADHLLKAISAGYSLSSYWTPKEVRKSGSFDSVCEYEAMFDSFVHRDPRVFDKLIKSASHAESPALPQRSLRANRPAAARRADIDVETLVDQHAWINNADEEHADETENFDDDEGRSYGSRSSH